MDAELDEAVRPAMSARDGSIAERLASFCTALRFADLPSLVVERTKDLLLDYLGVCYRGMQTASSRATLRAVDALSGAGPSTVVGRERGGAAAWAALVNGTAAHALEMDDVTSKSSLHPGVAVFPAVLALAEELDVSPREVILAAVAGYEVTMRVGNTLNPASSYRRGFHPTGVAGAFGAAAAASSLLQLDAVATTNALGIAGTMAAGSIEYLSTGAWTKRLNAGWAAHCGVVAARLAAEGFTGPSTVVEGPLGLLRGHTDEPFLREATDGLGDGYQVLTVSIKPYACCRYNHGLIDCMLDLRRKHSLDLSQISKIRLGVLSGGYLLVANPIAQKRRPTNVVDAQFSAPFAAAVALARRSAGFRDYTQANVDDPEIRGLMAKATCYRDASLDAVYPDHWPAGASILLTDGTLLEASQPYPLGEPENPVEGPELTRKFCELVDRPFADDAVRCIAAFPDGSLTELMKLFRR